jgi:hypothetical protein
MTLFYWQVLLISIFEFIKVAASFLILSIFDINFSYYSWTTISSENLIYFLIFSSLFRSIQILAINIDENFFNYQVILYNDFFALKTYASVLRSAHCNITKPSCCKSWLSISGTDVNRGSFSLTLPSLSIKMDESVIEPWELPCCR